MYKAFKSNKFTAKITRRCNDGWQTTFKFKNGFGASVVQHEFSYGGNTGKWELAVLEKDGRLCYWTEITDDVIGNLNQEEVEDTLLRISNLKLEV